MGIERTLPLSIRNILIVLVCLCLYTMGMIHTLVIGEINMFVRVTVAIIVIIFSVAGLNQLIDFEIEKDRANRINGGK